MAYSAALLAALKRELKVRGLTYADVARGLRVSEATVKRMFSRGDLTLKRLEQICALARVELPDLARRLGHEAAPISALTYEQEKEIIADRKLFLVAVCVLNHATFEQILATYEITEPELVRLLLKLDRLRFIELQPGNRIRLLVSRTFAWLPEGPIQRFFKEQAYAEYFRSNFTGNGEFMVVVNGMLSKAAQAAVVRKLQQVAREFSDLHQDEVRLPLDQRAAMSLLVAVRHWELDAFAALRRPVDRPRKNQPSR